MTNENSMLSTTHVDVRVFPARPGGEALALAKATVSLGLVGAFRLSDFPVVANWRRAARPNRAWMPIRLPAIWRESACGNWSRNGACPHAACLNKRSRSNAARILERYATFLPADDPGAAPPDLFGIYRESAGRQLAA